MKSQHIVELLRRFIDWSTLARLEIIEREFGRNPYPGYGKDFGKGTRYFSKCLENRDLLLSATEFEKMPQGFKDGFFFGTELLVKSIRRAFGGLTEDERIQEEFYQWLHDASLEEGMAEILKLEKRKEEK